MSKLLEMHKTYRMTKDEENMRINSGEVEIDKLIPTMHLQIEP